MAKTNISISGDEPIFRALLTPHRSLGRKGLMVLSGVVVAGCMVSGIFFLALGAWPVFGFFGLDIVLMLGALWLNQRAARAHEIVSVSRTRLDIDQIAPSGKAKHHQFNPFGTRFAVSRHSEIGITAMRVLGSGRSVTIGSFLNPDDRESFAAAFGQALATARR